MGKEFTAFTNTETEKQNLTITKTQFRHIM